MQSYKVFLTKSREAAQAMSQGFHCEMNSGNSSKIIKVERGRADDNELVPAVYYNKNYFCCMLTYKDNEDDYHDYQLIVC